MGLRKSQNTFIYLFGVSREKGASIATKKESKKGHNMESGERKHNQRKRDMIEPQLRYLLPQKIQKYMRKRVYKCVNNSAG